MKNKLHQLILESGLSETEARGIAFLSGMCAFYSSSREEFEKKIAFWSNSKSVKNREKDFGDVYDMAIRHDIEEFLNLTDAGIDFRLIKSPDFTLRMYEPKYTGRLRVSKDISMDMWDISVLYKQLCNSIGRNLGDSERSISSCFDCGLTYHQINHSPDSNGAAQLLWHLEEISPPLFKGILLLSNFSKEELEGVTVLHLAQFGFCRGLGQNVEQALWAALSFVIYDKNKKLKTGLINAEENEYYAACLSGLLVMERTQPLAFEIVREDIELIDQIGYEKICSADAMIKNIDEKYPGFEVLKGTSPQMYLLIRKSCMLLEMMKAIAFREPTYFRSAA